MLSKNDISSGKINSKESPKLPDWVVPTFAVIVVITALIWVSPIAFAYLSEDPIPSKVRNNSDRPLWFVIHVISGSYALFLGAMQMYAPLRNARRDIHRWLGRAYVVLVMVSSITSLALDPRLSVYGTEILRPLAAVLWIGSTVFGVMAIRNHDIIGHQQWMTRSYALAYMGITFLILSGIGKNIGLPIEIRYPLVIWLSLIINVTIAELVIFKDKRKARITSP